MHDFHVAAFMLISSSTDGNKLTASLPSEIGKLTSLTHLDFCELLCVCCVVLIDMNIVFIHCLTHDDI